jgi:uncharacterized protein
MLPEKKSFLFELNHPCHAHLFKHVIRRLKNKGYRVDTFIKSNKLIQFILDSEGISYKIQGQKRNNLLFKAIKQIAFTRQITKLYRQNNYSLAIGVSISIALASRFSGLSSLVLDDDDKKATPLFASLAHQNASLLIRPDCLSYEGQFSNTIYHNSLHELAYLHPSVFKPDNSVLKEQGLKAGESFFIIRLSALKAHHDIGKHGITNKVLKQLIALLNEHGKVIVLDEEEKIFLGMESLKISQQKIHHLIAFANLVISDGQTMCSEAACLGVPSVRINDFVGMISNLEELENRWKLSFGFRPEHSDQALHKIKEILETSGEIFKTRRDKLLQEKIKFTDFLEWMIINYPESVKIMKENPDFQYNFK